MRLPERSWLPIGRPPRRWDYLRLLREWPFDGLLALRLGITKMYVKWENVLAFVKAVSKYA